MIIIKAIDIILNLGFALLMLFFIRGLEWNSHTDRPAIIGLGIMAVTFVLNILMIFAK